MLTALAGLVVFSYTLRVGEITGLFMLFPGFYSELSLHMSLPASLSLFRKREE